MTITFTPKTINNINIIADQDSICFGDSVLLIFNADTMFGGYDTLLFDQFQMNVTSQFNYSSPPTALGTL